jgi:hypothetical protein
LVTVKLGDQPATAPRKMVHGEGDTFEIDDVIATVCPRG